MPKLQKMDSLQINEREYSWVMPQSTRHCGATGGEVEANFMVNKRGINVAKVR